MKLAVFLRYDKWWDAGTFWGECPSSKHIPTIVKNDCPQSTAQFAIGYFLMERVIPTFYEAYLELAFTYSNSKTAITQSSNHIGVNRRVLNARRIIIDAITLNSMDGLLSNITTFSDSSASIVES